MKTLLLKQFKEELQILHELHDGVLHGLLAFEEVVHNNSFKQLDWDNIPEVEEGKAEVDFHKLVIRRRPVVVGRNLEAVHHTLLVEEAYLLQ
jgi:hypothetical protein